MSVPARPRTHAASAWGTACVWPAAGELLDLCRAGSRQIGRQLVLRRARLKLVELEFKLIQQALLALRAPPVELAPELLDRQPQYGNFRLGLGHHGLRSAFAARDSAATRATFRASMSGRRVVPGSGESPGSRLAYPLDAHTH